MLSAIADFFNSLTAASVAIRLILAALMGALIGMERAHKRYEAGIRTFALVCLGSALATVTSIYMTTLAYGNVDITRIPAQILCGIGFLGAGTIIVTDRRHIKGLTTAAGLWVTATMGIAIGAGFIWASVIAFCLVMFTTYGLFYASHYVEDHTRTIELHVEIDRESIEALRQFVHERKYLILSLERKDEPAIMDGDIVLRVEIDMGKRSYHPVIMDDIMNIDGVHYVEELF